MLRFERLPVGTFGNHSVRLTRSAAGSTHTLFLCEDGTVYAAGLALPGATSLRRPFCVPFSAVSSSGRFCSSSQCSVDSNTVRIISYIYNAKSWFRPRPAWFAFDPAYTQPHNVLRKCGAFRAFARRHVFVRRCGHSCKTVVPVHKMRRHTHVKPLGLLTPGAPNHS